MKKIMVFLLILLSMTACSPKPQEYTSGTVMEIGTLNFEILNIERTTRLESYLGIQKPGVLFDETFEYLEIIGKLSNTSTTDVASISAYNFEIQAEGIDKNTIVLLESKFLDNFEDGDTLEVNETRRVHIYVVVKKELPLENITLNYTIDKKVQKWLINLNDFKETSKVVTLGEVVTSPRVAVQIQTIEQLDELLPSDTSGGYMYKYPPEGYAKLVVFTINVQNISQDTLNLKEVLNFKQLNPGKNARFSWLVEDASLTDYNVVETIAPGENTTYKVVTLAVEGFASDTFVAQLDTEPIEIKM